MELTMSDQSNWLDHYSTEASILEVVNGLLEGTWPEKDWKHREHCFATVGLLMLRPDIDLNQKLPNIIQAYNVAQGGVNSDSAGYHHTLTLFYLKAIRDFIKQLPQGTGAVNACKQLLASSIGNKDYPLRYYSKETLFSVAARRGWVEPDLAARK
jgi:hypothetical protein